jgi:hypothetical protein
MLLGRCAFAALAVGGLLLFSSSAWATQHHKRHAQPLPKESPPASVNNAPAVPSVPAREAAVPPEVSYENGQLLIDAKNSTLSDVLRAVEKHTGASFDIGSGDTSERVVGRLGPGPARDVLADLLNGSHFNYVILSPAGDPSALSRVVLTPRAAGTTQAYAPSPNQFQNQVQPFQQPVQISPALQVQQQNASADESADNGDAQDDNADADQGDQTDATQADQQVQQPQPGVKTPEQLLLELRQQQQQVIQQQQQQVRPGQTAPENQ